MRQGTWWCGFAAILQAVGLPLGDPDSYLDGRENILVGAPRRCISYLFRTPISSGRWAFSCDTLNMRSGGFPQPPEPDSGLPRSDVHHAAMTSDGGRGLLVAAIGPGLFRVRLINEIDTSVQANKASRSPYQQCVIPRSDRPFGAGRELRGDG
jgi:hypothetical protein